MMSTNDPPPFYESNTASIREHVETAMVLMREAATPGSEYKFSTAYEELGRAMRKILATQGLIEDWKRMQSRARDIDHAGMP